MNAWPILWWTLAVLAALWPVRWWAYERLRGGDVRQVDDADDAQPDDHRDPCDAAGGLTAAHRPDLLVPTPTENDPADLDTQPGVKQHVSRCPFYGAPLGECWDFTCPDCCVEQPGGILTSVTDLGDPYTETELRTIRLFDRLETRIRSIIMSAADDAVKAAVEQLNKARAEVLAQDASQDANAVSPETIQSLKDAAQSFDDLNPDAPADTGGGEETPDPQPGDTGGETPGDTGGNPDGETDTSE